MGVYTNGISSILVGAIASDGGPGTTLTALGQTYENSCKLVTADPTVTNFYSEESEDPVLVVRKKGDTTLTFQIMDATLETVVATLGGSISGTTPNRTWNAPTGTPVIEKTVRVNTASGNDFIIPRGQVAGKINASLSRKDLFLLDVTVTALVPTKAGVGPLQIAE